MFTLEFREELVPKLPPVYVDPLVQQFVGAEPFVVPNSTEVYAITKHRDKQGQPSTMSRAA